MSYFTQDEATGSTITRVESVIKDGTHDFWLFAVKDSDGFKYDWKDYDCLSGATDTHIEECIYTSLTTSINKKVPTPVITKSDRGSVIGNKPKHN